MTTLKENSPSHDTGYRFLFSHPEMVRDLIQGFVPDDDLRALDYSTLEMVSGHYITDELSQRADDVVWRVKTNEEWLYLYIVIEFQSSVDRYMALRMMVYLGLLYQQLIKEKKTLSNGQLPPVLPIVLYNGSKPWNAPNEIADLIPELPSFLKQFSPSMKHFVIDEGAFDYYELDKKRNLAAVVFQLEHPNSLDEIKDVVRKLDDWLPENQIDLRRMFAIWIRSVVKSYSHLRIALPEIESLKELRMTLEQVFDDFFENTLSKGMQQGMQRGIQQGRIEGIQEGQIEGEKIILRRLLTKRFGKLPLDISDRINQADAEQIETWSDAVLDAQSLYEVFENLH